MHCTGLGRILTLCRARGHIKTTKRLKKTRPSRSDSKLAGSTQPIGIGQSRLNMITTETDQIWQNKTNLYYLVFYFCLCHYNCKGSPISPKNVPF